MTFFYLTNNSMTYFAVTSGASTSPGLHSTVEHIKQIEMELEVILEVMHVPRTTIIAEGTNGLSQGIWVSLHYIPDRDLLLLVIFARSPSHHNWVIGQSTRLDSHPTRCGNTKVGNSSGDRKTSLTDSPFGHSHLRLHPS